MGGAEPPAARRGREQPPHQPTKVDRDTVTVMVAAGIQQLDIAKARGISVSTLRKWYRYELDTAKTTIDTMVVVEQPEAYQGGRFRGDQVVGTGAHGLARRCEGR